MCGGLENQVMTQCWQLSKEDGWLKTEPMGEPTKGGGSVINQDGDWWIIPEVTGKR